METPAPAHPLRAPVVWTVALAALDQACKAVVRGSLAPGERIGLVGQVLSIVSVRNVRGVSWFVPDLPAWGHAALTAALLVVLLGAFPLYRFHSVYRRESPLARLAAALLAAAAGGHLLDGFFAPYTTDWLRLFEMPAFNLADLYAYSGLACLLLELRWVWRQSRGLSLRERMARARRSRRDFLIYLKDAVQRRF